MATRTAEEQYQQAHINKMTTDTERSAPMIIYTLADYDGERIASFGPIHAGDFLSVELSDGSRLGGKVRRVVHQEHTGNIGDQIVHPFLEVDEDKKK
jgi:hypothetical protein